jgi:hypothetical protein
MWLVAAVQNTNGSAEATQSRMPEAQDIKSPMVVPRPK